MTTEILTETAVATTAVMMIISAADTLGFYMTCEHIADPAANFLTASLTNNPNVMLPLDQHPADRRSARLIEGTAALILLTPILVPVITKVGIDPVHFGLVMVDQPDRSAITLPGRHADVRQLL